MVAARKPPTGVVRRNVTVLSSSAAVSTSAHEPERPPEASGSLSAATVYRTSAEVTGSPSCHTASSRMWNVHVLPSSDSLYDEARSGSSVFSGPIRIRPLNTRPTSERSARLRADSGVIDVGCADHALAVHDRGRERRRRGRIGDRDLGDGARAERQDAAQEDEGDDERADDRVIAASQMH